MRNLMLQLVLVLIVATGVYFAPINAHLQNLTFLILAVVMFVLFLRAQMKLKTVKQ